MRILWQQFFKQPLGVRLAMATEDVRIRWVGFLDKLEGRLNDLLAQAAQALPHLLNLRDFDPIPFVNALTGVSTQARDLVFRIEKTWSDQVEPAFVQALGDEDSGHVIVQERKRGEARERAMQKALRIAHVAIAADGAQRLLAAAQKVLSGQFSCSQCKAPLAVRQQFFRSYYVSCEYCQTVNTFEPGMIARNVEHFCAHALAEEAALGAWLQHQDVEHEESRPRHPDRQIWLVKLYTAYIDTYLQAKVDLIPEYESSRQQDRNAKIQFYIQSIA